MALYSSVKNLPYFLLKSIIFPKISEAFRAIPPGEHLGAAGEPGGRRQGHQTVREGAGDQGGGGALQQDQQEEERPGQQWPAAAAG